MDIIYLCSTLGFTLTLRVGTKTDVLRGGQISEGDLNEADLFRRNMSTKAGKKRQLHGSFLY